MENTSDSVLAFAGVEAPTGNRYQEGLADVSFSLGKGQLAIFKTRESNLELPLSDAAEGLVALVRGTVSFLGRNWAALDPDEATQRRSRIGRVFEEDRAWVSNLDVAENIVLGLRHHTDLPAERIEADARALARKCGLEELPRTRPAWTAREVLRRAQWVRALLGEPELVLLDYPTDGLSEEYVRRLVLVLQDARARGAAVVWVTSEETIWRNDSIGADMRFTLRDGKLASA